ncbi:MAG: hypothetical protein HYV40_00305 [Candidatus Levybacteria bacterium]|nr:hypothetical protein [Candidatus Levybacteria bacterium]
MRILNPLRSTGLFIGLLAYYVVTFIPVIGWIVGFLVMLLGMGALLQQKYHLYNSLRLEKAI